MALILETRTFNTPGVLGTSNFATYTWPAGTTHLRIFAVAGGEGGWAGRKGNWGNGAGRGGHGGSANDKVVPISSIGAASLQIFVGAGGLGGNGAGGNFNPGQPGVNTVVNTPHPATFGMTAQGGRSNSGEIDPYLGGTPAVDATLAGSDGGRSMIGAGAGGEGAKNDNPSNATFRVGGKGGVGSYFYNPQTAPTPSPAAPFHNAANGISAIAPTSVFQAGNGGSGGNNRSNTATTSAGANGGAGVRGGGGGGGGSVDQGAPGNPGSGGAGGTGYVAIAAMSVPEWDTLSPLEQVEFCAAMGSSLWVPPYAGGLSTSAPAIPALVQSVIDDMVQPYQSRPKGVPTWYSWSQHQEMQNLWPPANWTAIQGLGTIYEAFEGNPATNTRIQLRRMRTYILSKATQTWSLIQENTIEGALYREDFAEDVSIPANVRSEASNGGGISVKVASPYQYHYWNGGRGTFNPADYDGVFVTLESRLIVDNIALPDDRATARLIQSVGADYWVNTTAPWNNFQTNVGVGGGRYKYLTSSWQRFSFTTVGLEKFRNNPPPLAIV